MAKFILHGGGTSDISANNEHFFEEMVDCVPDGGSILCVYFSRNENDWNRLFEEDQDRFRQAAHSKIISIEMALLDTFLRQSPSADLIYFRGGDMDLLEIKIRAIPSFKEILEGKNLAGSSAGAYLISTNYYTRSKDDVMDGLALAPIKVAAHYTGDRSILNKLQEHGDNLEIVLLAEGESRVIES